MPESSSEALWQMLQLGEGRLLRVHDGAGGVLEATFVDLSGEEVTFQVSIRASRLSPRAPSATPNFDAGLFASRPEWDEDELRARGLPLHWSREWLLRLLVRAGGRLAKAEQLSGTPQAELEDFRRRHQINNATEELSVRLWNSGRFSSQKALAAHLGISANAVNRYLGSVRGADTDTMQRMRTLALDEPGLDAGDIRERLGLPASYGARVGTSIAKFRAEARGSGQYPGHDRRTGNPDPRGAGAVERRKGRQELEKGSGALAGSDEAGGGEARQQSEE